MPIKSKVFPSGLIVEIIYFGDLNSCASYLQYKRYGLFTETTKKAEEKLYKYNRVHKIIPVLADLLEPFRNQAFTLVVVPSSGDDASFYFEKMLADCNGRDISGQFFKDPNYKASENSEHPERTLEAITYDADGFEDKIERLLILDDVVGTGGTIDAVIKRLHQAGMRPDTLITVVTPLIATHVPA